MAYKPGVYDPNTVALQKQLNAKGAGLVVDGIYGPKTDAAYKRYGTTTPAAVAPPKPAAPAPPPAYVTNINNLYNQRKNTQLTELRVARDKALAPLNQQRAQIPAQYQGLRSQADVGYNQGVQKLREIMAAQGLFNSGENVTGQVALRSARENAMAGYNTQQQQDLTTLQNQINQINNPDEEKAILSAIEADRISALQQARDRQQEIDYQANRDKIEDARYEREFALARSKGSGGGGGGGGRRSSSKPTAPKAPKSKDVYNDYVSMVVETRKQPKDARAQLERDEDQLRASGMSEADILAAYKYIDAWEKQVHAGKRQYGLRYKAKK